MRLEYEKAWNEKEYRADDDGVSNSSFMSHCSFVNHTFFIEKKVGKNSSQNSIYYVYISRISPNKSPSLKGPCRFVS
jgi:hypothetical protein